MANMSRKILAFLYDCRHQASQGGIGAREVEIVNGQRHVWGLLSDLKRDGMIIRGGRYCWLTESAYQLIHASKNPL